MNKRGQHKATHAVSFHLGKVQKHAKTNLLLKVRIMVMLGRERRGEGGEGGNWAGA